MVQETRPGRRPNPVPEPESPLGKFATGLRELRTRAGTPTFRTLSALTAELGDRYSDTTLRTVVSGRALPTLEATVVFVRACAAHARTRPDRTGRWDEEALVDQWKRRWRRTRDAVAAAPPEPPAGAADGPSAQAVPVGGLPAEITTFVGRETDLAEVAERLEHGGTVTLTGAGGIGKTRLALRVAARLRDRYRDGACLVELAAVVDPGAVAWAVGAALRISEGSADSPADALAAALADRELLLVLDNCEHLPESCAALVEALRRRAPGVRVLATSRRALGYSGEVLWRVPPLRVPATATPVERLGAYEAVALLTDRAAAVVPGFAVDEGNHRAVAGLCRLLDGVPLLLELAARGLRVLSPQQLLERLEEGLPLPDGSLRTAPDRHRTLRAVLDWSHDLCSEEERRAWARLSVFAGDFTLTGAQAVLAGDGRGPESALAAVTGLLDQSVLTVHEAGEDRCYRMLEPVRRYGRDRLAESGAAEEVRRRHRDWYLALVEQAESAWSGAEQALWFRRLRRGHADLRAALDAGLADPATARRTLRAMGTLWPYWLLCVPLSESRHWLESALRRCGEPGEERVKALWACGFVAALQRDLDAVDRCAEEIERMGLDGGEPAAGAGAALLRGLAAFSRGEVGAARAQALRALREYRRHDDRFGAQVTLGLLTLTGAGDGEPVAEYHREALESSRRRGERWHRSYLLYTFGLYLRRRGETAAAVEALLEGLEINAEFDDRLGGAMVVDALAWTLAERGEALLAARLLGAARTLLRGAVPRLLGFPYLLRQQERCVARLRADLGERGLERALDEGAGLELGEVVRLLRRA